MKTMVKKGNEISKNQLKNLAKESARVFYDKTEFKEELEKLQKEKSSLFFILKENKKLLAFGFLKPTKIKLKNKDYKILGIRNIIAIEQGKGYGSILMRKIIDYGREKEITILGFTGSRVSKFYKKLGFNIKSKLRNRFFPNYNGIAHWGFYLEGKDKFISRVLESKIKPIMLGERW